MEKTRGFAIPWSVGYINNYSSRKSHSFTRQANKSIVVHLRIVVSTEN